jgi:curved DNA-binding protein CbpA
MAKDHYEVLGLSRSASSQDVKKAFRAKAFLHPDLHPGDPEAERGFKEITAAYSVLRDPAKRAAYDRECGDSGRPRVPPTARPASRASTPSDLVGPVAGPRTAQGHGLGRLLFATAAVGGAAWLASRYAGVDPSVDRHRDRRTGRFRSGYFT